MSNCTVWTSLVCVLLTIVVFEILLLPINKAFFKSLLVFPVIISVSWTAWTLALFMSIHKGSFATHTPTVPSVLMNVDQSREAWVPDWALDVLASGHRYYLVSQASWDLLLLSKITKSWCFNRQYLPGSNFHWAKVRTPWHFMRPSLRFDPFPLPLSFAILPLLLFFLYVPCTTFLEWPKIVLTTLIASCVVTASAQQGDWKLISKCYC